MRRLIRMMTDSVARALPFRDESDAVMNREDFREYVSVNGFHFTDKLADYVTKRMDNADGTLHNWSTAQVRQAMIQTGLWGNSGRDTSQGMHEWMTDGDLSYLANMAYADFYPTICRSEKDCLLYAHEMAHDKDGYPEIAFMRWIADQIGKGEVTDFDRYV